MLFKILFLDELSISNEEDTGSMPQRLFDLAKS